MKRIIEHLIGVSLIVLLGFILYAWHWVFGDYLFAFAVTLTVWYISFGFECAMNGGIRGGLTMPFYYLWHDFLCNIPIYGKKHRLELSGGNQAWADRFPGLVHFSFMHVIFPAGMYFGILGLLGV